MKTSPKVLFTATEIAKSLGVSRFSVRRSLASALPSCKVIRCGNEADAWTLAAMPPAVREAFARAPLSCWVSPIPLAELHPECVYYATKLRDAFSFTFANRFQDDCLSVAELASQGVEDYRKVFGHPISPRHWQRLLERITTRDGGAENWNRLEIYLPDEKRLRRTPEEPRETPSDLDALVDEFNTWSNPLQPTFAEEKALYLVAFEWLEASIADGCTEVEAKRRLIDWLQNHAGLSKNVEAMRRVFNQKLKAWREQGADALTDGRKAANAANRAPKLSELDEKLLVEHAVTKCDGFIATAWRECYHRLSADTQSRYSKFQDGAKRKDYVPHAVAQQIAPKVELIRIEHMGEAQSRMSGPFIIRDWSGVFAGDIYSTDDATLEVYAAVVQEDGSFKAIRGQFFPWIDEKSKLVFGYSMLAKEHFNATDILAGLYDALEDNGVCRKLLRTENGIFKRARCLGRGEPVDPWSEHRQLFTDRLGIRWSFTRPRNPRGKIVENILRQIIRRLPGQSMFVGRHEQVTAREEVKWALLAVNSGRKHPHEVGMLTFDEWEQQLADLIREYNSDPQQSRIYMGTMSPLEAWSKFQKLDASGQRVPLTPFPRELRLMLSQPRPNEVKGFGIAVKINGSPFPIYFDDAVKLDKLRYQKVLVRIDPGNPAEIWVTDLRGENGVLVGPARSLPADGPTREEMSKAMANIKARSEYGKAYYRSLRPANHPGFTPVMLDAEARNTLVEIETQRAVQRREVRLESAQRASVTTRTNREIETLKKFLS